MVTVIVMAVLLYMKVRKKIGRIRITHPAGRSNKLTYTYQLLPERRPDLQSFHGKALRSFHPHRFRKGW